MQFHDIQSNIIIVSCLLLQVHAMLKLIICLILNNVAILFLHVILKPF